MLHTIYPMAASIEEALAPYNLQTAMSSLIVGIYGLADKDFDGEAYQQLVTLFRERWDYSLMNTNSACLYSALLAVFYENPSANLYRMLELVAVIRGTGFRSRLSNMMAFALLDEKGNTEELVARALKIYQGMHEHHSIITGEDDYLASVYLSQLEGEVDVLLKAIESNYGLLASKRFAKGNALQSLSHQLMLIDKYHEPGLIESVDLWHQGFKHWHLKTNGSQILLYGLLATLDVDRSRFIEDMVLDVQKARKIGSLETTIMILEKAKSGLVPLSTMKKDQIKFIKASLLMMLVSYMFREKLV